MVENNQFDGLRELLSSPSTAASGTLTREDLERCLDSMFATLRSDEYAQQFREREKAEFEGMQFLTKAWKQGIITDSEFEYLYATISINGCLIVHPKMAERLKQVVSEDK